MAARTMWWCCLRGRGSAGSVGTRRSSGGIPRQVVGVVASERAWPGVEVFVPLSPDPDEGRDNQIIEAVGRLAPGVGLEDARADVAAIAEALAAEYPASNEGWGAQVITVRDWLVGPRVTRMGHFLLGAVTLLLLMACASVANLRVAEASVRLPEMGVRAALGAGRRRIALQLLVESLVLAGIGCVVAVVLTYQALPLLRSLASGEVARLADAAIDAPVLAVALAAAFVSVVVSGLAPALVVNRSGVLGSLRAGARGPSGAGRRLRDLLVAGQLALAVAVVLAAGLMTRSFVRLQAVDLGFDSAGMVRFAVRLPEARYAPDERQGYLEQLQDALASVPGVEAVGATNAAPFSWSTPSNFVARSDREPDRQQDFEPVSWRAVSGDYFEAAGIRLLAGRTFRSDDGTRPVGTDAESHHPPVIIDRALADLLWPGGDPVGRPLTWFQPGGFQARVVGVVSTVRDERIDAAPRPRLYHPYGFAPWAEPSVVVRAGRDPAALIPALRRATLSVDPEVPAMSPTLTRDDLREKAAWPRLGMQILTAFATAALLLAAMGVYGVTAFAVARRRREIGVRMALGARPAGVMGLVLRRVLVLTAAGIAAGLVLALLLTGFLDRILYDVSSLDAVTFVAVPTLLAVVALAAAWIPARRAMRLNPRDALLPE